MTLKEEIEALKKRIAEIEETPTVKRELLRLEIRRGNGNNKNKEKRQ